MKMDSWTEGLQRAICTEDFLPSHPGLSLVFGAAPPDRRSSLPQPL